MKPDHDQLASLFPNIAAQLKQALSNLNLAASALIPAEAREQDPTLDAQAALLDQSYYRLLRMVHSLSSAEYLVSDEPLPLQDQDLVPLVTDIFAQAESMASLLGLEMRLLCPSAHLICAVNKTALEQLLFHLLSNALKFTPSGGTVTVELQLRGKQVHLSVADTGPGIPEEQLLTLFDRYLHSDVPLPPPHGLGLGLPLCRCIAQRHGGTLLADPTPGKGSRFVCSLPLRQVGGSISDTPYDYSGGFNRTLLALADALPAKAFLLRNQG